MSTRRPPQRILFVCLGNICRSPMAEALFRHQVQIRGWTDRFVVDSAATGPWHVGERPHRGTQRVLNAHAVDWTGITARQLTAAELSRWDWILVMDEDNYRDVMALGPTHPERVRRVLEFDPLRAPGRDVPDPYATGRFDDVYKLLERAVGGFLDYVTSSAHGA
ncbi:MAG: low molecular weight phosphotyrosine protein phosphatase [Thermaerobacter sp.]|nr:low molecular weight phosphotyrosine protein phosphatase [Thermaerobacter sp.]